MLLCYWMDTIILTTLQFMEFIFVLLPQSKKLLIRRFCLEFKGFIILIVKMYYLLLTSVVGRVLLMCLTDLTNYLFSNVI